MALCAGQHNGCVTNCTQWALIQSTKECSQHFNCSYILVYVAYIHTHTHIYKVVLYTINSIILFSSQHHYSHVYTCTGNFQTVTHSVTWTIPDSLTWKFDNGLHNYIYIPLLECVNRVTLISSSYLHFTIHCVRPKCMTTCNTAIPAGKLH